MPLLLLIRHGENDYVRLGKFAGRLPGVHLNGRGQRQAQELAEGLRQAPLSAIYASPLERAVETALPLAKAKGLKVIKEKGLIETDLGDWVGGEIKKISRSPEWKVVQHSPSRFRFPNGESFQEAQTRLVGTIEKLVQQHGKNDRLALFFHADPIKMVIAYYLGMPLDHFQRIACQTASLSLLNLSPQGAIILGINLRPSLDGYLGKVK